MKPIGRVTEISKAFTRSECRNMSLNEKTVQENPIIGVENRKLI